MQFISQEKYDNLKKELEEIKNSKIPEIAKKIDEARQQGDLSENAEYHAAREEMAWIKGKEIEINGILDNSEIIEHDKNTKIIQIGSKIIVKKKGEEKSTQDGSDLVREYELVGVQEADPLNGKISNESPLGSIFYGHKIGDEVEMKLTSGKQIFKIIAIK